MANAAALSSDLPSSRSSKLRDWSFLAPAAALLCILVLQFHLVLTRSINWDEFYFLSLITDYQAGAQTKPLQTLHIHLFGWLTSIPATGVDQIIAGRIVMFLCEIVTGAAIIVIAKKFVALPAAMLSAAAYLSSGFVMQHGFAFRADPLAAMLMMVPLGILARSKLRPPAILIAGLLIAMAGMVSIKAALLSPAFVGIALWRWSQTHFDFREAMHIAAVPVTAVAAFATLYVLHSNTLPDVATISSATGKSFVAGTSNAMFFLGIPEYWRYAAKAALLSLPLSAAIVISIASIVRIKPWERIAITGLITPLLTVLFYHNTLPYFYAFMLPPVAAGASLGIAAMARRYGAIAVSILMFLNAATIWVVDGPSRLAEQRSIQLAASEIFPERIAYFDFPAMLPQFGKANFFMTHWGLDSYRRGYGPSLTEIMQKKAVPLVLTVDPEFDPTLYRVMNGDTSNAILRPEDTKALTGTYEQFWGPFWIAGTTVGPNQSKEHLIRVPGPYTVKGSGVSLNGAAVPNGEIVTLERGTVSLRNDGKVAAKIQWGNNLQKPDRPEPARPYWTDF